jgi:hypothetical protein
MIQSLRRTVMKVNQKDDKVAVCVPGIGKRHLVSWLRFDEHHPKGLRSNVHPLQANPVVSHIA